MLARIIGEMKNLKGYGRKWTWQVQMVSVSVEI
jgi:hypothetical protein